MRAAVSLDYRAYPVLYVDDELPNLRTFRYACEPIFRVLTASSGPEALDLLRTQDVAVVFVDQVLPEMSGVEVCERARAIRPDAVRILVTAYSDIHAVIGAINRGQVSRYVAKPWRDDEILDVLRGAIDAFERVRATRELAMRLLGDGSGRVLGPALAGFVHDLVVPLHSVRARVEAALAATSLGDTHREIEGAVPAIDLMDKLADMTRAGLRPAASEQACDAARVVRAVASMAGATVAGAARIDLAVRDAPRTGIDATSLAQILVNLVLNAAQAIEQWAAAPGTAGTIAISLTASGAHAVLTVSDDGPGIAPEHLARIFEPGFTTRAAGTGLGLTTAREIVRACGGDVVAYSEPGRGATFEVRLPLQSPSRA